MVINLEQKKIHFDLRFILTYNVYINQFHCYCCSDLEGLRTTAVRSAYSDPEQPPDVCYLKSDVEKK